MLAAPTANAYVRSGVAGRPRGRHARLVGSTGCRRWQTRPVTTRDADHPGARRRDAGAHLPAGDAARARTVLLTGGVHAKGIDEPRLVKLAGDLAAGGTPVVTAEVAGPAALPDHAGS